MATKPARVRLAEFFTRSDAPTKKALADHLGVDKSVVSKILAGDRGVSVEEAFGIEEFTDGAISARAWAGLSRCA